MAGAAAVFGVEDGGDVFGGEAPAADFDYRADNGAEDMAQNSMKMMNWMMPVLMLVTTFTMPAAMGLYWIISGLMSIITSVIVYFMFTKPYEAKKAEIEAKKDAVFKKGGKAALAGVNGEVKAEGSKKNGKKKKN